MRPIILLAYTLTFTAGLINAVTVLGLGDIFASSARRTRGRVAHVRSNEPSAMKGGSFYCGTAPHATP